jgi:hypothetical protein
MQAMHLEVHEERGGEGWRRVMRIIPDGGGDVVEVFHESAMMPPLTNDTPIDAHVLCQLLYAMKCGRPLVVHGALSVSAMRNLDELQRVWLRWKPNRYKHIEIRPERIIDARRVLRPSRAIAAFSGGADGIFTALCHARVFKQEFRYPLSDVMLVHGFDVNLDNCQHFEKLVSRVRPLIDDLGLQLRTIKTNSKDWDRQDWDDSFVLELSACLHMFGNEFDYALVGSGSPYDSLEHPWGSSPITDPFKSGDLTRVVHDGAGFSRTEKMAEIGRHPLARKVLKVCWAGEDQSDNCGRCEKCTRTMINFLAAGHTVPECFPGGLRHKSIKRMKIYNSHQMNELRRTLDYARDNGVTGEWMTVLARRLNRPLSSYSPPWPRRALSRVLELLGLKQPLKRLWDARNALRGST